MASCKICMFKDLNSSDFLKRSTIPYQSTESYYIFTNKSISYFINIRFYIGKFVYIL